MQQVTRNLNIGFLIYPDVDQADFTGPFEILSRIPGSACHVISKTHDSLRDVRGLILTPETTFAEAPHIDVLVVPGGAGQEALMNDEVTLSFVRDRASSAQYVFSVCTGALLCGAAGLLRDVRVTTHWAAFHLLKYFGAIPVNRRVVIDGNHISAAGVTAGLDGALQLTSLLCGEDVAQQIQLAIEYAPEPALNAGTPETAPTLILDTVRKTFQKISDRRLATAQQVACRLGIPM